MSTTASIKEADSKRNIQGDSGLVIDIKSLREHTRRNITDGARTPGFGLDRDMAVNVLNAALATELVCVVRYWRHQFVATGINAKPIAQELAFLAKPR